MKKLSGKVFIITGGARGVGAADAERLVADGAAVAIADVLDRDGEALVARLREEGHQAQFWRHDVTSEDSWISLVGNVTAWQGGVQGLVNNAGIVNRSGITSTSIEAWNRVLAVNLTGVFLGMKTVAPAMRDAGGGDTGPPAT